MPKKRERKRGEPPEAQLLNAMAVDARTFLQTFKWCPPIEDVLLSFGVGKVIALFLVKFASPLPDGTRHLWVVVGDLPSVYMVTDNAPGPRSALEGYCELMQAWIDAVRSGTPLDQVYPVSVAPTAEYADLLERRLDFIRKEIIPVVQR